MLILRLLTIATCLAAAGTSTSSAQGEAVSQVLAGGGDGPDAVVDRPAIAVVAHVFQLAVAFCDEAMAMAFNRLVDGTAPPGLLLRASNRRFGPLLPVAVPVRARLTAVALRI